MVGNSRKGSLMWSFDPVGFLQMIYIDRGEFDKAHYKFDYSKREFLGEVRCIVFDVTPAPKARGVRFFVETCGGRIPSAFRFLAHQCEIGTVAAKLYLQPGT